MENQKNENSSPKSETCKNEKETQANTLSAQFRKAIPSLTLLNTLLIIGCIAYMVTLKPKIIMLPNVTPKENKKEQEKNTFFGQARESEPNYHFMTIEEKQKAALKQIMIIKGAICNYRLDTGYYPLTGELSVLLKDPGNVKNWKGPYIMDKIPKDPWGNDYVYIYPGKSGDFDVISYGEDGKSGGTEENKDITGY